jgi:protocatechuate 3,4-dioxygenase beta subunit
MGDTVLTQGGSLIGRVTDLDGNGILAAEVELEPANDNGLTRAPSRNELLPPASSDATGFFSHSNLMPGEYRLTASAKNRLEHRRRQVILIEEGQEFDVGSLALGPGYEILGYVYDKTGEPLAGARIELTSSSLERTQRQSGNQVDGNRRGRDGTQGRQGRDRGGRGGFRPVSERTRSREDGSFGVDHLPSRLIDMEVSATGHLTYRQAGIDPSLGQVLTVQMEAGLTLRGIVLDEDSATPVTSYAAKLRRERDLPDEADAALAQVNTQDPQARSGRGRRGGDRGGRSGQRGRGGRDGRDGGRRGRGSWWNPNRIPDDLGDPEEHPDGEFAFDGLDEGIYRIDIASPDHHMVRSDPIELRRGVTNEILQIALSKGHVISGFVLDRHSGEPIVGAEVELMRVRESDPFQNMAAGNTAGDPNQTRGRGGRRGRGQDFARMARAFAGNEFSGERIIEVESGPNGAFEFPLSPPAKYFVVASSREYARSRTKDFELTGDQQGIKLELGHKASLEGLVTGIPVHREDPVQVLAISGIRSQNRVLAAEDGSYRFEELEPGDYVVRAFLGDARIYQQQLMRELFSSPDGQLPIDLSISEGQDATFNLLLEVPEVGNVKGRVLVNGEPVAGYRISLQALGESASNQPFGRGRGGRGGRGGGNLSDTSASDGGFSIDDVQSGEYSLRAQAPGGRRGGDIYKTNLIVQTGLDTELAVEIFIGNLEGTVTSDDNAPPVDLRGRVFVLPGATEVPENLRNFARTGILKTGSLSEGKFEVSEIPVGPALLVLRINGREDAAELINIQAARKTTIQVKAGQKKGDPKEEGK